MFYAAPNPFLEYNMFELIISSVQYTAKASTNYPILNTWGSANQRTIHGEPCDRLHVAHGVLGTADVVPLVLHADVVDVQRAILADVRAARRYGAILALPDDGRGRIAASLAAKRDALPRVLLHVLGQDDEHRLLCNSKSGIV